MEALKIIGYIVLSLIIAVAILYGLMKVSQMKDSAGD
jgi:hypothetical protein